MSAAEMLHEEEALGRAVDSRLLARLWIYVAPYKWLVLTTLLFVFPMLLLQLAPAWIVGTGLDRLIAPAKESSLTVWETPFTRLLHAPPGIPPLVWLAGLYLLVSVSRAGLQYLQLLLMIRTGEATMRDLRGAVFERVQNLHMGFFDRYPVGRLVTRATSDVEHVSEMFAQGIVALVTDLIQMVGFAAALFLLNTKLALATFCVVPFLAVAAVVFRFRVREAFRKTRVLLARINATIQETVTGMKVVQLFTREDRNLRDFAELNGEHRDAWLLSIRYDAALFSVVEFAGDLTVAIIIWYGTGIAELGVMYVFIQWMRLFFMPLRDISAKYSVMQSAMASLERIFQLMDTEPAIRDPEPGVRPLALPPRRGAVEFQNVSFAYGGEEWVLRNLSFRVEPGERVALVGATGAGKTTVIKLLARLYEVREGRILLDGVDIRELPQSELRKRVAMVLQDVFLFSGSVADNIALGREGVTQTEIERAAVAVEAHRFIARLPDGYATEVRERGTNLSAGQRQLLSFARALAHRADVLVLDEATSSIDTETEALIQTGIHALMEGKTALVVAHRLSTIEDVDRIYVLHRGRLVESGSHAELLDQRGIYHRLYRLQYAYQGADETAAVAG